MSQKIVEHRLRLEMEKRVELVAPPGSELLDVGARNDQPVAWIAQPKEPAGLAGPDEEAESPVVFVFVLVPTGGETPAWPSDYLRTLVLGGGNAVAHVYRLRID